MKLLPGYDGWADFADGRKHRIWLSRVKNGNVRPIMLWIGMNPSTADDTHDDMTVRKEIGFGERKFGVHQYVKMNVATLVATLPIDLKGLPLNTMRHRDNIPTLACMATSADFVVMATGNLWNEMLPAFNETMAIVRGTGKEVLCLGRTGSGWPRHPSRIGYDTAFETYR